MAEFKIVARGGLEKYADEGYRVTGADFAQALLLTPEPVLEEPDFTALLLFCRATKNGQGQRTVAERAEGHRLLALVEASKAEAFTTKMLEFLCTYLRGDPLRGQGRPQKVVSLASDSTATDTVAAYIYEHVLRSLEAHAPLEVPRLGLAHEEAGWDRLPVGERAMLVTHKLLRGRGFKVTSPQTLRNRLSRGRRELALFNRE